MISKNQSCIFFIIFLFISVILIGADGLEDISFHLMPGLEIPFGEKSALFVDDSLYNVGGSATLKGQFIPPLFPLIYVDGLVSYNFQSTQATPLSLISAGAGTGLNLRIGNIMSFQVGAKAGWYMGFFQDNEPAGNPFFGGNAALSVDFSPTFTLSAGAGYNYYLGYDGVTESFTDLYQGLNVTLGTSFKLSSGSERTKLKMEEVEIDPVFPVFYSYYDSNSLGRLTIRNEENSPITDVKVYLDVGQYMDQPKLSGEIPVLKRREEVIVDLYALFSNSVLQLTEPSKVSAEITTEYTYLGQRFTRKFPFAMRILNRNSMTWDDDRKAASFVTPKDPTVLLFSKNTAGLVREHGNNAINRKFREAIAIFEALRIYGMNYVIDPNSSYIELSENAQALDYLQFPSETLTYRAGDCDDLSILFSALLESIDTATAFITIPGHIYMAFSLGITENEAKKEFTYTDDFLFVDDETWVPVEITMVTDGFMKAWKTGARQWREASKQNVAALYKVRDAWQTFEPVSLSGSALSLLFPSSSAILASYDQNLDEIISLEVEDKAEKYMAKIRGGSDTARVRNSLGVLYARFGLYGDAEQQFIISTERDNKYAAPLVNLGNLYFMQKQMTKALSWYEKAARYSPTNEKIIAGLARTQFELEKFDEAALSYNKLTEIDPDLADKYSYLAAKTNSFARAAAAQDKGKTYWEDTDDDIED